MSTTVFLRVARSATALVLVCAALGVGAPAHAGGGGKQPKAITASETYVQMPAFAASVSEDFMVRALLQVEVGLDIPDARLRRRAETMQPRVRAALAQAVRGYAGDSYAYGRVPDLVLLSGRLQAAVDEALGEPGATVLLGMVIAHDSGR